MSDNLSASTLQDTTLWKRLLELEATDPNAKTLTLSVECICKVATDRIKLFASLHPQYTLHDEVHFLGVAKLAALVMPQSVIEQLNALEIAILILSCYLHDQGMVVKKEELSNNADFKLFEQNWTIEHSNFTDIKQQLKTATSEELVSPFNMYHPN